MFVVHRATAEGPCTVGNDSATQGTAGAQGTPGAEGAVGEGGDVVLSLTITKTGSAQDISVITGPEGLRAAAIKAVKRTKQKPILVNGSPLAHPTMMVVTFKGEKGHPQVREFIPGGVPGCITVPVRVRVAPRVMETLLLKRIDPVYPQAIQVQGPQTVALQIFVGKDGSVVEAVKVTGPDELGPLAVEAVKQWKYRPYLLNGEPVGVETSVEILLPKP